MVYLIILNFITFLLAFSLKLLIAYFFIKFFNRTVNFWAILKPILLYELGVSCFFIISPTDLLNLIIPHILLFPIVLLVQVSILFLFFRFIMRKFALLDFKKSLLIFFAMFLIVTPLLSFSRQIVEVEVAAKLPISFDSQYNFQEMIQRFYFSPVELKSTSDTIYQKVNSLNEVFLEEEFLNKFRQFIMTF